MFPDTSVTPALSPDGAAYCWGSYGGTSTSNIPVLVSAPEPFAALEAGDRTTCGSARDSDNIYCWGINTNGQLGDGTTNTALTPQRIQVTVGPAGDHTCGLSSDTAYCWGSNSTGQLGTGDVTNRLVPTAVNRLLFKAP